MTGGHIQGEHYVPAGPQTGALDGAHRHFQHGFGAPEGRGQPPFVRRQQTHAIFAQGQLRRRLENGMSHGQHFVGAVGGQGHHLHVLRGYLRAGVLAPAEQVDHRQRHGPERFADYLGEKGIEGDTALRCRRPRKGQRHGQQRVGPQPRLVGRAVQGDQRLVQGALRSEVAPGQCRL